MHTGSTVKRFDEDEEMGFKVSSKTPFFFRDTVLQLCAFIFYSQLQLI